MYSRAAHDTVMYPARVSVLFLRADRKLAHPAFCTTVIAVVVKTIPRGPRATRRRLTVIQQLLDQ